MKIQREQVIKIIKYLNENPNFYFPFKIICKNFKEDSDYYETNCLEEIDYKFIESNKNLTNFYLEENLQNLYPETVELMVKGFLHKIEHTDILNKISNLAIEYRKSWKEDLCESESIEEYGLNEFLGGKAEAYEDCVQIINEHLFNMPILSIDVIIKELEKLAQIFETNNGDSINYSEIYKWQENATLVSINEMSQNILELINGEFDLDDEELYLVAESIVQRIKAVTNK
jgi:hypothetical protein